MDIKDLLPPKVILSYELIAKTKLIIMLIAATKSDESNNID